MDALQDIRKDYQYAVLTEDKIQTSPFNQFSIWLKDAIESNELEPSAMTLATVDVENKPHARTVLLKDFSENGFVFYTNYESNKAEQMKSNANVALLFFWQQLERQIRIEGTVEMVAEIESDAYFASRPIEHQLGAWASAQSKTIPSAQFLEEQFQYFKDKFKQAIPRPPHWGGYIVKVERFEFWQGRPNRLHDRIVYTFENNQWTITRIAT